MNSYLLEGSDHLTVTNIISKTITTEKFNSIPINNLINNNPTKVEELILK